MIYTTAPLPKSQLSPDAFQSRRIADESPCPVAESRISIVSVVTDMKILMFFQYLWAFTAAQMLGRTVAITSHVNGLLGAVPDVSFLPRLSLISTFRDYSETTRARLAEIGFTLQSAGRYKYVKGPAVARGENEGLLGLLNGGLSITADDAAPEEMDTSDPFA